MPAHADRQPVAQFKVPRLRVVWKPAGAAEARWWLGLLGYGYRETPRRLFLYLALRGAALWAVGLALAGFFTGTGVLAYLWGRNPYNEITYADLVLPTRWSTLREKRGAGLINEGLYEIRRGHVASAWMLLNRGVAYKPADIRGRIVLAQLLINGGQMHRGLDLLVEGLAFGRPPRTYRDTLFKLTTFLEDHERALEIAERLEVLTPASDLPARSFLLGQRAVALEKLHRDAELAKLRENRQGNPCFALEAAWARSMIRLGRGKEALAEVRSHPENFGVPADYCQLLIELGAATQAPEIVQEGVNRWRQFSPVGPEPRIEEILALIQMQQDADASDRLKTFFLNFGTESRPLKQLLKRLSDLQGTRWLRTAYQEASSIQAPDAELQVVYVQGLLMNGEVAEGMRQFEQAKALIQKTKLKDGGWVGGTELLVNLLAGDSPSARSQFIDYCTRQRLTPESFRFLLRSVRSAGKADLAAQVAGIARHRFRSFQDVENGSPAGGTAPALASTETPPSGDIRSEFEARAGLRKLDDLMSQARYAEAAPLLARLSRTEIPSLQPELLRRRIRIQGELREQSDLSASLQLYLAGRSINPSWLRELAQRWDTETHRDSALTVARETMAKYPDAKWAGELRKKIEGDLPVAPLDIVQ